MHLENTREEGGARRRSIVLVAKVIPLGPLVHKYAQIGRVLVEAEEQFVQIVSGMGCLEVYDYINARLNIKGILPLQVLLLGLDLKVARGLNPAVHVRAGCHVLQGHLVRLSLGASSVWEQVGVLGWEGVVGLILRKLLNIVLLIEQFLSLIIQNGATIAIAVALGTY